jgi:hypothetical protein
MLYVQHKEVTPTCVWSMFSLPPVIKTIQYTLANTDLSYALYRCGARSSLVCQPCSNPPRPKSAWKSKLARTQMSNCIRMSSPSLHPSSLAVLSSGVCTSSSSLLRLMLLLMLVAIVAAVVSLPPLLWLLPLLFLNHPRLPLSAMASMSEV